MGTGLTLLSPQSYITCALGIHFVGYVMICFSATDALCSVLYGKASQFTGRVAIYALGTRPWLQAQLQARGVGPWRGHRAL